MSEMVERVARALAFSRVVAHSQTSLTPEDIWSGLDPLTQEVVRINARAAIAAMREPTADMKEAGGSRIADSWAADEVDVYKHMIDAALRD